jgi:hypothetical protein
VQRTVCWMFCGRGSVARLAYPHQSPSCEISPSSSAHDVPSKHLGASRLLALELSRLRRIATIPFMPFDTVAEREGQLRAVFAPPPAGREIGYDGLQIEDPDMFRRLSTIGKTMIDPELTVLHTGRRAHQLGWPRLIFMWLVNSFFVSVYNRSFTKEWKAIR